MEKNSRDKFLSILHEITDLTYSINEDGYLTQEKAQGNKYDKKIKQVLLTMIKKLLQEKGTLKKTRQN